MKLFSRLLIPSAALLTALLAPSLPLPAASSWSDNGTDANWSTAANWTANIAPAENSDLEFSFHFSGTPETVINDLLTNVNSLTFNGQGFLLQGNAITLGAGGMTNNSSTLQTISLSGVTLGASQTWTDNGATAQSQIVVTAPVNLNGNTLTVTGSKNTTISGVVSGIPGSGIIKSGDGTLFLNNANSYAGTTVLQGGGLFLNNNAALGTSTLSISGGTLGTNNDGTTLANNISVTGDFSVQTANSGAKQFILDGGVDLGGATRTITGLMGTNGTLVLNGIVSNGGLTFTAVNPQGIFALGGASSNTYTGLTTVETNAELQLNKTGGATAIAGDLLIGSGGVVFETGSEQIANTSTVTVNSTGNGILSGWNLTGNSETIGTLAGNGTVSLDDHVSAAGTLTVGAGTFGGVISDGGFGGQLVKNTTGTLTLTGNNTYTGQTTINNGTLVAGGSTALGTGDVSTQGGFLTLGNGNHVLTIGGTYAQGLNGGLSLSLVSNTVADQINVTGTASLAGTLVLNLNGLPTTQTATYDLLTSSGLTGQFTTVDLSGLQLGETVNIQYGTDDVVAQIINFLNTLDPNQRATLIGFNQAFTANPTPGLTAINTALSSISLNSPNAFGSALDQLMPLNFARFTSSAAFNNASFETQAMDSYLAGRRGEDGNFLAGNGEIDSSGLSINDPSYDPALAMVHSRMLAWNPAPFSSDTLGDVANPILAGTDVKEAKDMKSVTPAASGNAWNFFIRGNVILAQGFSQQDISHFDDNTESVVLGADYRVTPHVLVGLTAAYGHTDATLDNYGSSATVDSYSPGFYASYTDHGWYANASGNYLHNAYTDSRVIGFLGQTATSAPQGNEGVANLDGGYDFHHGALTFGPLAGLQYTHLSVDGYNEGGSFANLTVDGDQSDSLRSRLGGRVSYALQYGGINITPHLDASWQHEFMDQSRGITSQFEGIGAGSFVVRTDNPSRESALIDLGVDADLNRTVTAFADYDVEAGQDNYFGQSVQAGVKIGF